MRSPKKIALVAAGVVGLTSILGLALRTPASAAPEDERLQYFSSYYDCQYAGNVYAQQGQLHWFNCEPWGSGFAMHRG